MQHANEAVTEVRRAEFFRKGGAARELIKGKHWLLLTRWVHLNTNKKLAAADGVAERPDYLLLVRLSWATFSPTPKVFLWKSPDRPLTIPATGRGSEEKARKVAKQNNICRTDFSSCKR
jgi:hypothetical protein